MSNLILRLNNNLFLIIINNLIFISDTYEMTYFCDLNKTKNINIFPKTKNNKNFIFINKQVLTFENNEDLLKFISYLEFFFNSS